MFTKSLVTLALAAAAQAHMYLSHPPALAGPNNPYTETADNELNFPYNCCGKEDYGLCHGHIDKLNTPEGKPVVTWNAGQTVNFTLSGQQIEGGSGSGVVGGTHYGGSCQVGFSVDGGKNMIAAATWNGNCPLRHGSIDPSTQKFEFQVPENLPAGDALFVWTWVNREKEYFQNCASVSIGGGSNEEPELEQPTPSPIESARPRPTGGQQQESAQYTLHDCTCECSTETFSQNSCTCYDCSSPETKRHVVARKALALHNQRLNIKASLKRSTIPAVAPVRRASAAAVAAFNAGPKMITKPSTCAFPGNPVEIEFPSAVNVHEGDGEYTTQQPEGDCT